ncbi:hypothetical protein TBLA_0A07030 [Henningerozyma blattae CBS 6284]|uniref:Uncharacterized protein n=1 Tax=Henningerozyma blattae (strain ATCC 34711 / CBS 6284 / DSM 70876 / NBRC 10599 / NRRL Y-10934 / UCD 77-7) TaxID=1071380 RepID=I2GWJ2_HENB6|nr:hypothetical protein TBLA_0A07030 [Tetrapisispora blattae CBS 6284]CCH58494.1 hypothetical protein TBLA_0A07030 [Tetrapisispora blattae CBS 6284]
MIQDPQLRPSLPVQQVSSDIKNQLENFLKELLFPNNDKSEDLNNIQLPPADQLNSPLDDEGNTPLHWLVSVAHVTLVRRLIEAGADSCIGCARGETPLMRAVSCTNNYDAGTFESLLDILEPSIICVDTLGRTVFHHIALATNVPACAPAAKYYLDILMGWIVRNSSQNLKWVLQEMLPARDKNGETCLNIAERLNAQSIVEALNEYGATNESPSLTSGAKANSSSGNFQGTSNDSNSNNDNNMNINLNSNNQGLSGFELNMSASNKSDIPGLVSQLQDVLGRVENEHKSEIKEATETFEQLQIKLNIVKEQLVSENERLSRAKRLKEQNLILSEQINSISEYKNQLSRNFAPSSTINNNLDLNNIPIKAQIEAYKRNQKLLDQHLENVIEERLNLENKFRRVLALCLKVDEDKVDGMLDGLLQAIEAENGDEPSTGEMQEFLKRHGSIVGSNTSVNN